MFLTVKEIRKHFGEGDSRVEVLNGIDAEIEKGEICVLLGPSGSGKSTLLNIIGGIDSADSGYIAINGEKTADMNEKRLTLYRRKHLGYIFQQYNLIPNLNIKENVEIGAYLSDNPLDTDEILKTLGLYEHRHKLPNQLSGGQQQRVCIARTLALNPKIILFDEPMSALDVEARLSLRAELKRIQGEFGTTMIYITHDQEEAFALSDRIMVMGGGRIHQLADPEEIIANPADDYVSEFVVRNLRIKMDSLARFMGR